MPDDFQDVEPKKQGMSSTAKVLVILGSIAGVCLLACCGGGIFVYMKAKDAIQNIAQNFTTTDPDDIRARTADIVHIDIPEEFPPLRAFDFFFMKQIIYGRESSGSMVMIMEVNESFSFAAKAKADAANPKVQEWEQLMWKFQQPLPQAKAGEKWMPMERIFSYKRRARS